MNQYRNCGYFFGTERANQFLRGTADVDSFPNLDQFSYTRKNSIKIESIAYENPVMHIKAIFRLHLN